MGRQKNEHCSNAAPVCTAGKDFYIKNHNKRGNICVCIRRTGISLVFDRTRAHFAVYIHNLYTSQQ